MDVKQSLLKEIYNIEDSFQVNSKFDNWHKKLLNKTIQEFTLDDVYTMLRQNNLLKLAIEQAYIFIKEDRLAGVMYDGQLLEV
ncbi:contact-dependent growth inhibition system immunity protein, partial [Bacillus sp. UNC437CL72CviS29]|uniref:contact-dependent growth inhibition system immunity protein n=1 Tax=Bacillus sp. UNC437CL72CviS29 TaxID=1340430 RepID=UPI00054FE0E3